ncbi:hypothetical protein KEM56_002527, partial [Ascosphaera pollenicola]
MANLNQQPPAAAASSSPSSASASASSGRASMRSTPALRSTDPRRQSGSPSDPAQRRNNNSPKAWSQNLNPITQKPTYPAAAPHRRSPAPPRPVHSPSSLSSESNTPDMHANDRLAFLFAACTGLQATVITSRGDKFQGIFTGVNREQNRSCFMLKMTRNVTAPSNQASNRLSDAASPFLGSAPDHAMSFDFQDIADLQIPNVTAVPANTQKAKKAAPEFKTDTDISGHQEIREKPLQRWEPEPGDSANLSLDGTASGWDQFAANERLFGAKSTWDETLYTTKIDRTAPSYNRKAAEAMRIAREIESGDVSNPHMREERGLAVGQDFDEEARYSGVQRTADASQAKPKSDGFAALRSGGPGKYTAPAKRAPTGTPTVPGAPVDPAIISATMAKPDGGLKLKETRPIAPVIPTKVATPVPATPEVPTPQPSKSKVATDQPSTAASPAVKSTNAPVIPAIPSAPAAAIKSSTNPTSKPPKSTSSRVESEVLENFRKFANNEKLKVQERRRNQVSHDRTIRLNELMKFSQNFKLGTPVPDDLVPILAKDPSKQEAIIEKARRQYEEKKNNVAVKSTADSTVAAIKSPASSVATAVTSTAVTNATIAAPAAAVSANLTPTVPAAEPKTPIRPASGKYDNNYGGQYGGPTDRLAFGRGRGYAPAGPHAGNRPMSYQPSHQGRPASGHLSV